ncbi:MAG TPA: hypothetical protein VFA45_25665 [Actinomycetes bacterium]|nr:hypothetical protein [Actinomycetes bacterium]
MHRELRLRLFVDDAEHLDAARAEAAGDRASFFVFPRPEVAPVVYHYACKMVEGKPPGASR